MVSIHADFRRILADFLSLFGGEAGLLKYDTFITQYGLDTTQSYASQLTRECLNGVCESFGWAKPLIQYLKKDKEAKYYKVRALTATLSMNANDYSDLEEIERSARTLTWRPLNLNHDHRQMLPFPQNRVDWAEYDEKAVEAIIRIDNEQSDIQDKLDNGEIVNPSIEGEPRGGYRTEDGRNVPSWYNFTALALLEKDASLPGVPTTIGFEPLFLNESLGHSLVESLSLENEKEKNTMSNQEKVEHKEETIEETLIEQGIQGIEVCAQCKFFEDLENVTTAAPAAPGSSAIVTHSAGAIGPGVGRCTVLNEYVKKADAACIDGRPRDQPTNLDRTIEMKNIELEAKNMVLEGKVADLESQLLTEKQKTRLEGQGKITAMQESLSKDESIKRLQNDAAEKQSKISRLTEQLQKERLDNMKLGDSNNRLTVESDSLKEDVKHYKDRCTRLEDKLGDLKKQIARLQEDLKRTTTKANDESATRAEAVQRAVDIEDSAAKIQRENAILVEEISTKSQEIYDGTVKRSASAKREMALQKEVVNWRKKNSDLVEEYRELKQLYNNLKDRKKIRVNVKT